MRLTLRTLLAYLDEILEPDDADQLRKKIEDSEFATSLVHQIRTSVGRRRLDSPALDAQGIGGDLNTIAEYLDNTLPPERVPELEKICLENEMHLSEVAACHQILTLVLGQAADVKDTMRRRAYAVAPTVALPEADQESAGVPIPPSPVGTIPAPPTVERPSQATARSAYCPAPPAPPATNPAARPPIQPTPVTASAAAAPVDAPSTKEAWRAQSRQQATVAAEDDPLAVYAPRRRSPVLRNVVVTALIALLVVAALVLALWPGGGNQLLSGLPNAAPSATEDGTQRETPSTTTAATAEATPQVEAFASDAVDSPWKSEPNTAAFDNNRPVDDAPETGPRNESLTSDAAFPLLAPANESGGGDGAKLSPTDDVNLTDPLAEFAESSVNDVFVDTAAAPLPVTPSPGDVVPDSDPFAGQFTPDSAVAPVADAAPAAPPIFAPERTSGATDTVVGVDVDRPTDASVVVVPRPREGTALTGSTATDRVAVDPGLALLPDPINLPVASPAASAAPSGRVAPAVDLLAPSDLGAAEATESPSFEPITVAESDVLLLTLDRESGAWRRVDPETPLTQDSVLLGMPAFRTQLGLSSGTGLTIVDASRVELGPAADLTLDVGRLLLSPQDSTQRQGVVIRGERLELGVRDAGGLIAVEATKVFTPGSDPEREAPHWVVKIYAQKCAATVSHRDQTVEIPDGQHLLWVDDFPPRIETGPRPRWVAANSLPRTDVSAARDWKRDLPRSDPADIRLWFQERANEHYNERALAARCLAEMDQFDAIVAALRDPEQHAYWDQHIATLRSALTRGTEVVNRLRNQLDMAQGDKPWLLLEMIRGYSQAQLAGGAAELLVETLSHRDLEFRVLASENLREITGLRLPFHPEKPLGQRRQSVNQWRGRLKAGRIVYAKPPEIVALLESFANVP